MTKNVSPFFSHGIDVWNKEIRTFHQADKNLIFRKIKHFMNS